LLIQQTYTNESNAQFMRSLLPFFADPRYIRINNHPLLVIYNANSIPDREATVEKWEAICRSAGIPSPYLVWSRLLRENNLTDFRKDGFAAAVEFPPNWLRSVDTFLETKDLNQEISMNDIHQCHYLYRYESMAMDYISAKYNEPTYKCVVPCWDNTARRKKEATIFHGASPIKYCHWLRHAIKQTETSDLDDKIVFINAWNEWAEGCHLEPDMRFGQQNLLATMLAKTRPQRRIRSV
jgi:hypothetical protein